jgi:hypothetical protein
MEGLFVKVLDMSGEIGLGNLLAADAASPLGLHGA